MLGYCTISLLVVPAPRVAWLLHHIIAGCACTMRRTVPVAYCACLNPSVSDLLHLW